AAFQAQAHFSVNILSHQHEQISNMFARPSSASWDGLRYTTGENGCALFAGALSQLECRKFNELDGGDHVILIGEVTRIHQHDAANPLLFYRWRYGTYSRDLWDKLPPPEGTLA